MPSGRTTISCRFFAQAAAIGLIVFTASAVLAQPPSQVPPPRPFPQPPPKPDAGTPDEQERRRRLENLPQPVPGAERWSAPIGANTFVPPVMTDTQVFAVVPPAAIAAFRIDDGAELWRVELTADHPLAVDEGRVFVASGEAIHALDAATGSVVWRQPAGVIAVPPLVYQGWIVTGTASDVAARRASDGTIVWQQPHGALTARPTIDGDTLYLPLADARVKAVDLTTGALKWERVLGGAPSEIAALAGRVYVGSGDRYFYCLDAGDGDVEWRARVGAAVRGRPAIDADRVYFAAMDNLVRAVDRVDGALKWQAGLPFRPSAGPVLLGTLVVVPGAVAELKTFEAKTGKPGRPIAFGAPLASPLAVRLSEKGPIAATVTGGLTAEWRLTLWEPSTAIPIAPLTVLPGTATALPATPPPGGAP